MEIILENSRTAVKLILDVAPDPVTNTSAIRVDRIAVKDSWSSIPQSCWLVGEVMIDGVLAAKCIVNNTQACAIDLQTEWYEGGEDTWSGYTVYLQQAAHEEDGSKNIRISADLRVFTTSGKHVTGVNSSGELALPLIARKSSVSVLAAELGQPTTIRIARLSTAVREDISWQCGDESGTVVEETGETEILWTPPVNLAFQAPNDNQVDVILTVVSRVDGTEISRQEISVPCGIPARKPSVVLGTTDHRDYLRLFGGYVQNKSQVRVRVTGLPQLGASIAETVITCGILTASGDEAVFSLPDAGRITITATVTDSRGNRNSQTATIDVLDYHSPACQIVSVYRCDAGGVENPEGAYAMIEWNASVKPFQRMQNASYAVVVRSRDDGTESVVAAPTQNNVFQVAGAKTIVPASVDGNYAACVRATDYFGFAESASVLIGSSFRLIDCDRASRSIGIGGRARLPERACLGLAVDMGGLGIGNLAEPVEDDDAATKGYVLSLLRSLGLME